MGAKYPAMAINTGEQNIVAAIGGARASLINFGKYFDNHAMIRGAKRSNPAVAKTDNAKPASRACHGSPITTAAIAKPNAGKESLGLREPFATNKTAAIAAARNTDGDGRTKAINDAKNIAVAPRRHLSERTMNCIAHKTNAETIAKFAPLTATKCVNPERFMSALNVTLCLDVSPRTIPGINAPASPDPLFIRRPFLMDASDLAHRDA
jgi:hypothetical protein